MSLPSAKVGLEAASAAAADATDREAAADLLRGLVDPVGPSETASDARRAVAPATDASWRAGFHLGYTHGGYARGNTGPLLGLASASAYVPGMSGGESARDARVAEGAPGFANETPRVCEASLDAVRHRTEPCDGPTAESATRYGISVSHSEAWASALLAAASRSRTTSLRPRNSRRARDDGSLRRARRRRGEDGDASFAVTNDDARTSRPRCVVSMTRLDASRALRSKKVLAALARRAVADADRADAFLLEPRETRRDASTPRAAVTTGRRTDAALDGDEGIAELSDSVGVLTDAFETSILVGYQGDALAVSPDLPEKHPAAWTAAPFEPVGGRGKDVLYFVVAPCGGDAVAAAETAAEIRAQYAQMRLGTMEEALREEMPRDAASFSFSYEPETRGSFDDALARVARAARDATRPGPFLAYVTGSSSSDGDLATYAAVRAAETAEDARVDFALLPRNRLGRRKCTPAFARERAASAFAVSARPQTRLVDAETKTSPSSTRKATLAWGDAFGVSRKEPARLAAFEPLVTVSRRRRGSTRDASARSAASSCNATLCAYAFSARPSTTDAPNRASAWLVASWTDEAGETFAVEARAADEPRASEATEADFAELADWLVDATHAFDAARAAAAGGGESTPTSASTPRETDGDDSRVARAARRARAFFDASSRGPGSPAEDASDALDGSLAPAGADVAIVEVVPARLDAGNRAFATALRAALARRTASAPAARRPSRVLLGSTRVVSERAAAVFEGSRDAPVDASLRADGSAVTRAIGSSAGAFGTRSEEARVPATATRVAEVGVASPERDRARTADDSSRVAFAHAALARAARFARGVDRGERATVRDVAPPHVMACASLAETLRDLEQIASGRGE